MGKRKAEKTPFKPWMTTRPDGIENRYVRMGNTLMLSPAVRGLSGSAFMVYCYMRLDAGENQGFIFPRARYHGLLGMGPNTFLRAVEELETAGLLKVRDHNAHRQKPNVYVFTETWKTAYADPAGSGAAPAEKVPGRAPNKPPGDGYY